MRRTGGPAPCANSSGWVLPGWAAGTEGLAQVSFVSNASAGTRKTKRRSWVVFGTGPLCEKGFGCQRAWDGQH